MKLRRTSSSGLSFSRWFQASSSLMYTDMIISNIPSLTKIVPFDDNKLLWCCWLLIIIIIINNNKLLWLPLMLSVTHCCPIIGQSLPYILYMCSVQLFMTPWTVAFQAPLSMGFPRQEYWSGLPFPSPIIYTHLIFTPTYEVDILIISILEKRLNNL